MSTASNRTGTVKLIADNGELLGIFRVEAIEERASTLEDDAERVSVCACS